jgi:hypothetical protein
VKRWKILLATVLIFASGVATGALGLRAVHRGGPTSRRPEMPPSLFEARFDVLKRMQQELTLSPEQSARIEAILQEGRKRTRQIWDGVQPQVRDEMKRVREQIQAELNPEQRTRYQEIFRKSRDRHGPRSEGPGRPGGWPRTEREGPSAEPQASPPSP